MFISFEGLDFSGKTTQIKLLEERLNRTGKRVIVLREPGGTAISEKIREMLLDKRNLEMSGSAEMFLFSAARAQLVSEVINPALAEKAIVICDRFFDSTTAYQGYGRGIGLEDIEAINRLASRGTTPDLTVLLLIEIDEIIRRQKRAGVPSDRMESSGADFYRRVHEGYLALAKQHPHRFVVFDGAQPVQGLHEQIANAVESHLMK
ncbi:MAG TPA: dTMP kinase [Bacteroidota bacterium]|nr:dTMP kinase [Bacteroidota bacterium]